LINVIKTIALLDTYILLADNLQHIRHQMHSVWMEITFLLF